MHKQQKKNINWTSNFKTVYMKGHYQEREMKTQRLGKNVNEHISDKSGYPKCMKKLKRTKRNNSINIDEFFLFFF